MNENPLVALFFACGDKTRTDNNNKTESSVLVFKVLKKDLKFTDSDQVGILSNFAYFDKKAIESIKECLQLSNWGFSEFKKYSNYKMHEYFDEQIKNGKKVIVSIRSFSRQNSK